MSEPFTITKLTGFGRGKAQEFTGSEIAIGTASTCDVRLDPTWDKTVSPNHAAIRKTQEAWVIEDQSSQGTFIDGRRITREPLRPDAVIELGKGGPRLKLEFAPVPAAAPAPIPAPAPQTVVSERPAGSPSAGPIWLPIAAGIVLLALVGGGAAWYFLGRKNASQADSGIVAVPTQAPAAAGTPESARSPGTNPGPGPGASPASAVVQNAKWKVIADMGGQIYPSFLLASGNVKNEYFPFQALNYGRPPRLGDPRGLLGIEIQSPAPGTKVHLEIKENELMRDTVSDQVLEEGGSTYRIYPPIAYRFDTLLKVKQTVPLAITAELSVNGGPSQQLTKTVQVASINDCPAGLIWREKQIVQENKQSDQQGDQQDDQQAGQEEGPKYKLVSHEADTGWMFAAYVNENHPISDELRKAALKTGVVRAFEGYQGKEEMVYQQVFALWNVLRHRGVTYSSITTTPEENGAVDSQQVRFIDQCINNAQANCVDGSILFASLLRQIGIEPVLILVPGHCFLAFEVDQDSGSMDFLETTMIGDASEPKDVPSVLMPSALKNSVSVREILAPYVKARLVDQGSVENFNAAILRARQEFSEHSQAHEVDPVSVAKARAMGVMPIGYQP